MFREIRKAYPNSWTSGFRPCTNWYINQWESGVTNERNVFSFYTRLNRLFEALAAFLMKTQVVWDMTLSLLVISCVSEELRLSILRIVFLDYRCSTCRASLLGIHGNGHNLHILVRWERFVDPSSTVILLDW